MPDMMNYIKELADEVGPRPASTEEEHQGAQRIAEWFAQRDVDPTIEEFNCPTWVDWPYVACYLLVFLAALITAFHGVVGVLALVLAVIALGVFAYERYLSGSLASFMGKGLSQNVVARYVPRSGDRERRKRKIVIVAHYDSERSALEASSALIGMYPLLQKVVLGCMVAIPVLLIVQMIPAVSGILNILWIVTCVVALVPFGAAVGILIRRFVLRYPSGANDNASGIGAMMGAFEQIVPTGDGLQAASRALEEPRRHSARRAREAGVVPDDAEVVYSYPRPSREEGAQDDEGRTGVRENTAVAPHVKEPGFEGQAVTAVGAAAMAAQAPVEVIEQKLEKTAGTSDAVPRKKYKPAYEMPESKQGSRNSADVPEWWARVESRRKEAQGSGDSAAVSKARSRFADLPSSDFKREDMLEKERQEAEQKAKAALAKAAPSAVPASMPLDGAEPQAMSAQDTQSTTRQPGSGVTIRPAVQTEGQEGPQTDLRDVEATKPQKPVMTTANEVARPAIPQVKVQAADLQEAPSKSAALAEFPIPAGTVQAEAKSQTTPLMDETRAMPPLSNAVDRPEAPAVKKVDLNSRLAHLPSIEEDDSFVGLTTSGDGVPLAEQASKPAPLIDIPDIRDTKEPSLINDDDFGMVQPAPISSSYFDTPQGGASGNFSGSSNLEPVITRVEGSDSFSPLQAGTFSIGETGAFVPIGNTGSFSIKDAGEDDIFITDADDSSLQIKASAGDFETPSNIDIPSSRTHKLLDSVSDFFSRDKKKNKSGKAINEWLDVDEDFEATSAGRDIGSWDNFDDTKPRVSASSVPATPSRPTLAEYDYDDAIVDDGYYVDGEDDYFSDADDIDGGFKWKGGGASSSNVDTREQAAKIRDSVLSQSNADLLNKEIWFVALGASGADHAGMKAFLAAHEHELSGATFINIECVGAGELSYVECEGIGLTRTADHRLQGLLHKIARATDLDLIGRKLNWRTTDLTPALKAGFRGVTLMAFGGTAPVAWRQKEDTMAIIEPSCVEDASNLLVEIIRNS